jgi:hypothetical protein
MKGRDKLTQNTAIRRIGGRVIARNGYLSQRLCISLMFTRDAIFFEMIVKSIVCVAVNWARF